jgi:hypothetical protein
MAVALNIAYRPPARSILPPGAGCGNHVTEEMGYAAHSRRLGPRPLDPAKPAVVGSPRLDA